MTLRRFPWKESRLSDTAFRFFAAEPTDEQRSKALIDAAIRAQSDSDSTAPSGKSLSTASTQDQSHQQSRSRPDPTSQTHDASRPVIYACMPDTSQHPPRFVMGPWRLLQDLPEDTRHIIGRMLELDPNKRATSDEILADMWLQNAAVCRQEDGRVIRAREHEHTLAPSASAAEPMAQGAERA